MKNFTLVIFIIAYCSSAIAAPNPTRNRYEFAVGKYKMTYQEKNDFGSREPDQQVQDGLHINALWQHALWPPYLLLSLDFDSTSPYSATTTNETIAVHLTETTFKAEFLLPLIFEERLGLGFTSSYNILYNLIRTKEFTFESNFTILGYPNIVFFPTGFEEDYNLSFYANMALVKVATERQDTTFGVKLFLPFYGKKIKYPLYAYQSGIVIKIEYNKTQIILVQAEDQNFIFDIERIMGSVGFSF